MRYYELTYLFDKNLTAEEQKKLAEKVITFLPNPPAKKEDGFFLTTLEFYSPPEKIKELEKNLKTDSQILKFMILIKEASRIEVRRTLRKPTSETEKKTEEKKVELKEIEKKLDEILKE